MDGRLKFKFDIYQRRFKQPLRTSHGIWQIREGIIISLIDRFGVVSQGEIAPLPWFGSETMSQAVEFCQQLGETISLEDIAAIANTLPACQFAFESAVIIFSTQQDNQPKNLNYCYLLPAGESALTSWQNIYQHQAATTFKWKIGVLPLAKEIEILQRLVSIFPPDVRLRLDANGGLNLQQARQLLSVTDTLKAIAFIEQPLSPDNFADILQLRQEHTTLLALDESIASFRQLQIAHQQGWDGVYVIKAAIMGFPSRLKQFCQDNCLDIVLSSVFETKVGRGAVLKMAGELNHPRAVGFGVQHFYD
ncbi:MAG TPA: o-succinylbenzoate synthase [Coleofasciculaceae cyanobacterium]|jgi:O-succinylbenzoate synthase